MGLNLVVITYTFDVDVPAYIFNTEEEAKQFLKEDFEAEIRLQKEENNAKMIHSEFSEDGTYACMVFPDGDKVEWNVTFAADRRNILKVAYDACQITAADSNYDNLDQEKRDVVEEAANLVNAIENAGYAF